MIEEVRDGLGDLDRVTYLGSPEWDALMAAGVAVKGAGEVGGAPNPLTGREAELSFDDPINIQYTSGTTGFPKGATLSHHNILNNGYFIGEGCRYTERDRVCIPVPFYHCFGMVLGNLACTTHGACIVVPGRGFEPAVARGGAARALHVAVRRAHHVHRRTGPIRLRQLDLSIAADRDHGRRALPDRGDEAGRGRGCT